ncbi:MAG: hypothetical protein N4A72_06220 [Bacteroidales bacterium]|jgi:hypothetical protein|nr:hypothetical protein [Bacteroidales bacterium]
MKRQVQKTGIRQWYGDDLIDIQNETITAIEAFYQPYGACIIKGCNITNKNISEGIVYLDGKIMRFLSGSVISFPVYLKSNLRKETREYDAGGVKDVAEIYEAVISTTVPDGEYITINEHGGKTFRQAFQDANNRMVTDAMINNWNATEARAASDATSKANSAQTSAINTLRGSVTSSYNTLEKLYNWITSGLSGKANKNGSSTENFTSKRQFIGDYGIIAEKIDFINNSKYRKAVLKLTAGTKNINFNIRISSTYSHAPVGGEIVLNLSGMLHTQNYASRTIVNITGNIASYVYIGAPYLSSNGNWYIEIYQRDKNCTSVNLQVDGIGVSNAIAISVVDSTKSTSDNSSEYNNRYNTIEVKSLKIIP